MLCDMRIVLHYVTYWPNAAFRPQHK